MFSFRLVINKYKIKFCHVDQTVHKDRNKIFIHYMLGEWLASSSQLKTKFVFSWVSPEYGHEISGWYLQLQRHQLIATVCFSLGGPIVELEIISALTMLQFLSSSFSLNNMRFWLTTLQFLRMPSSYSLNNQGLWLTSWNGYIVQA